MLHRQRLLNSENHVGEEVGDVSPLMRVDFEDDMVYALEEVYMSGKLLPFREFVKKNRNMWPRDYCDLMLSQDNWMWYTVYFLTCTLRRMLPRWEHAANKLKDEYNMDPQQIPPGTEWIHI